ncbi:hypothetical protein [Deinococcus sp. KSM4-11]|nr:hypothetical protein [Deinococcus sp. KSM4-11]
MNFRDEAHPIYGIAPVGRICRSRRVTALVLGSTAIVLTLSLLVSR